MTSVLSQVRRIYTREHPVFARAGSPLGRGLWRAARPAEVEIEIEIEIEIDQVELLELVLGAAAARSGAAGLPPLRWVEVSARSVELVLASPAPAPPGFRSRGADRWVSSAPLARLATFADRERTPVVPLVPVGTTDAGAELLVAPLTSGVLSISGSLSEAREVVKAMAVAAATGPWSESFSVVLVGLEGQLADLPQVRTARWLGDAIDRAEAHAGRARALPWLVISADPPDTFGDRQRLAELAELAERSNRDLAVVVAVGDRPLVAGLPMRVTGPGRLQVAGLDVDVRPHRPAPGDRTVALAEPVEAAIATGRTMSTGPTATSPGDLPGLLADVEVLVRVLGEVEAVRLSPGAPADNAQRLVPTRQKGLEAVVYLAINGPVANREELEIGLFPDGANAAKTMYNIITSAQALVGAQLLPPGEGGGYELSDRVVTDDRLFTDLVALAAATDDIEQATSLLTEALGLVRGEPFTGAGRHFAWVGGHRATVIARVIDAAEELAEIHLARGDGRSAEWAARRGLRASPGDERMYRLLMRAAHTAGDRPGVRRVFQELVDAVGDVGQGNDPHEALDRQTVALLEELAEATQWTDRRTR